MLSLIISGTGILQNEDNQIISVVRIRNWRYLLSYNFEFANNIILILFMGLVIGWFTFICNMLWIVLSLICIILLTIYNCHDLADVFNKMEKAFGQTRNEKKGCERGREKSEPKLTNSLPY